MSGINWSRSKMRQRVARQGSEVAVDKADLLKASKDDLRKTANRILAEGFTPKKNATPRPQVAERKKSYRPWEAKPRGSVPPSPSVAETVVPVGLIIYADGCCEPNPGVGGWGFVAYLDGREIYSECGGDDSTTNNVMEITGALMALRWLAGRADRGVARLICDSRYVVDGCNDWRHGWKKKNWKQGDKERLNAGLWRELDAELTARPLRLEWCRGHAGIVGNERADRLSQDGRRSALAPNPALEAIREQLRYTV